jgi:hypothetical protein
MARGDVRRGVRARPFFRLATATGSRSGRKASSAPWPRGPPSFWYRPIAGSR